MIKISGVFKSRGVENTEKGKLLYLTNRDNCNNGKYIYTYYHILMNDKVLQTIDDSLKKKIIAKKAILSITGFQKVNMIGPFTNLAIIPETITEYSKNN